MRPPSTTNVAPFTNDDSSLARKSAALTISRGFEAARRPVDPPALERRRVVAEDREQERRLDRPGAERVHAHALARELDAELARHREHRALRRRVRDLRGRGAEDRDERGDVDHRAAAALEQVRDPVLAAEEDALRVHVLDALPRLDGRVEDGRVVGRRDAGVVVEHVDAAEALGRGGLSSPRRPPPPRRSPGTRTPRPGRARPSPPRAPVDVGDADLRALRGEDERRLAAHPPPGARDHAHLAVQTSRPSAQPSVEKKTDLTSE